MNATSKKKINGSIQSPSPSIRQITHTKKIPGDNGLFGLLSDWKIDTQLLKDELRD